MVETGDKGDPGLSGYTRVSITVGCGPITGCTFNVICPGDRKVLGGGPNVTGFILEPFIMKSYPSGPRDWTVRVANTGFFTSISITAWATCAYTK